MRDHSPRQYCIYCNSVLHDLFVNILTNDKITIPTNIEHIFFVVERRERIEMARKVIKAVNAKHCMIFANSKYDTDEIAPGKECVR